MIRWLCIPAFNTLGLTRFNLITSGPWQDLILYACAYENEKKTRRKTYNTMPASPGSLPWLQLLSSEQRTRGCGSDSGTSGYLYSVHVDTKLNMQTHWGRIPKKQVWKDLSSGYSPRPRHVTRTMAPACPLCPVGCESRSSDGTLAAKVVGCCRRHNTDFQR